MLVFGTRPEAIKMAPLVHALRQQSDRFETLVCVTAQHREMLDQVLELFEITPDIDLKIMMPGQDLYDITSTVLLGMRDVIQDYSPDAIVVHGDTSTTLATSVAAFYANIPVGHVEAGLRTFDFRAPFPEEFNRQITTKVATWHFAPTQASQANLMAEKVLEQDIYITGNSVIDALHWVLDRIESDSAKSNNLKTTLNKALGFNWQEQRFILITGHRRENFGDGFLQICDAIATLAQKYPALDFVYPVHLNPNVQAPVHAKLADLNNVHLIKPLTYEPFVYLLKHCFFVITDSGGIQEEAPSLGKPVLVMRDVTERPEAVESGTVELVGANKVNIVNAVTRLVEDKHHYAVMARAHNPYGDGNACARIVEVLSSWAANTRLQQTPKPTSKRAVRRKLEEAQTTDAYSLSNR